MLSFDHFPLEFEAHIQGLCSPHEYLKTPEYELPTLTESGRTRTRTSSLDEGGGLTVVHRFVRYPHLEKLRKLGKSIETPRKSRFRGPRTSPRLPQASTSPAMMFQSVSERPGALRNDFSSEIDQNLMKIIEVPSNPSKSLQIRPRSRILLENHPFQLFELPRAF